MIYGIEYCTEMRHRNYKIKKFCSLNQAKVWVNISGQYTYPAAAKRELLMDQQNFHRTIRKIYSVFVRMPTTTLKNNSERDLQESYKRGRSIYDDFTIEAYKARWIEAIGEEIDNA